MTLDALGNIGEVVAAFGVVVSLGYLAGQIRQNTKAIKAASHHSLNDAFNDYLKLLIRERKGSGDSRDLCSGHSQARRATARHVLCRAFHAFQPFREYPYALSARAAR